MKKHYILFFLILFIISIYYGFYNQNNKNLNKTNNKIITYTIKNKNIKNYILNLSKNNFKNFNNYFTLEKNKIILSFIVKDIKNLKEAYELCNMINNYYPDKEKMNSCKKEYNKKKYIYNQSIKELNKIDNFITNHNLKIIKI